MKLIYFSVVLFLVLSVVDVSAQIEENSTVENIKAQVNEGKRDAILEAANTGDIALIPYFKELASNVKARQNSNSAAFFAHIALAKLNDMEAFNEILAEVNSDDPYKQDSGIIKLGYIGNRDAYKKLYELLDDDEPRENPLCRKAFEFEIQKPVSTCDVIFFPRNVTAILALLLTVPDPPTKSRIPTPETIQLWKAWFVKNNLL